MDVLIKNIELPKDDEHGFIIVFTKGLVVDFTNCKVIEAIELPPHGRLKDESVIIEKMQDAFINNFCKDEERIVYETLMKSVMNAPTVLEAGNGFDN